MGEIRKFVRVRGFGGLVNANRAASQAYSDQTPGYRRNGELYALYGEARLKEPITGLPCFSQTFPMRGPRDAKGRGLRGFDLKARLFRYPLNYMIYSEIFNDLPNHVRDNLYHRLYDRLSRLPEEQPILEILADTQPHLPEWWRKSCP